MFEVIEAIGAGRRLDQPDGTFAIKLFPSDGITTSVLNPDDTVKTTRPCVEGDVLSVQPDGTLQGREATNIRGYEKFTDDDGRATISPDGVRTYIVAPIA